MRYSVFIFVFKCGFYMHVLSVCNICIYLFIVYLLINLFNIYYWMDLHIYLFTGQMQPSLVILSQDVVMPLAINATKGLMKAITLGIL